MTNPNEWTRDMVTAATPESEAEAKATRDEFKVAVEPTNEPDQIWVSFPLTKLLESMHGSLDFCITVELE